MDYKKEYEQLTKFIKDLYPFMSDYCKEKTEEMFSELQESEDERIRKTIIKMIEEDSSSYEQIITPQEMIAWLKKQGKHIVETSNRTIAIDFFVNLAKQYEDVDDILDGLRSLNSEGDISDNSYDYICNHWDEILKNHNLL